LNGVLRKMIMNRSKAIVEVAEQIGKFISQKNESYGSAYGFVNKILRDLYAEKVEPNQYLDFVMIARVLEKISRISHHKQAFGEDPWKDIAGYALCRIAEEKTNEQ